MQVDALKLIHVDAELLVLDKPSGLLAVPGLGPAGADSLSTRVQQQYADALVVHRLDMATSGLMLFARGLAAQRQLAKAFEQRQVAKRYEAWVEGSVEAEAGQIDAPLAADWPRRPRQQVDRLNGKSAVTHWHVLKRGTGRTRLMLQPVTGRTHQLRVHLLSIGHPICGDALYAPLPLQADRLLLHATALSFAHPGSGQRLHFANPAPF
ncbi:MAG: RluA family pseudouridine synthase [Pseudomonadota bacterium]|nr:RluA family pseudouridine synthase [Pseudomonadota bacterium]